MSLFADCLHKPSLSRCPYPAPNQSREKANREGQRSHHAERGPDLILASKGTPITVADLTKLVVEREGCTDRAPRRASFNNIQERHHENDSSYVDVSRRL